MPTYVYKFIDTGETVEVQQSFTDPTLTEYAHPESGAVMPVKKVFQPVGVTFKGSGFFKNDNRGAAKTSTDTSSDKGSDSKKSTTSDSKATTSDSKSDAKKPAEKSSTTSTSSSAD